MTESEAVIARAYAAFNRRDIGGALALMSEGVSWPKASEGGRVVGKEAIRAYWMRQWEAFDPEVEPVEMREDAEGRIEVRVHQRVKSMEGEVLSDGEVWHVYSIVDGLIDGMELKESGGAEGTPTEAFARRSGSGDGR
jgi:ketosteroid isomerase-like protein